MNTNAARIEALSAAVQAIAAALPPDVASRAARGLQQRAAGLGQHPLSDQADAAIAGELAAILGALARTGTVPRCSEQAT